MYVEFNILHIYFLPTNISIVLKLTTLKLHCILVWRDFLIFLIILMSLSVLVSVRRVKIVLYKYYLFYPKSNEE